jgi:hypothetical protein
LAVVAGLVVGGVVVGGRQAPSVATVTTATAARPNRRAVRRCDRRAGVGNVVLTR